MDSLIDNVKEKPYLYVGGAVILLAVIFLALKARSNQSASIPSGVNFSPGSAQSSGGTALQNETANTNTIASLQDTLNAQFDYAQKMLGLQTTAANAQQALNERAGTFTEDLRQKAGIFDTSNIKQLAIDQLDIARQQGTLALDQQKAQYDFLFSPTTSATTGVRSSGIPGSLDRFSTGGANRFNTLFNASQQGINADFQRQQTALRDQVAATVQLQNNQTANQLSIIKAAQQPQKSSCKKVLGLFGCGTSGFVEGLSTIAGGAVKAATGGVVDLNGGTTGTPNINWGTVFNNTKTTPPIAQTNAPKSGVSNTPQIGNTSDFLKQIGVYA